MEKTMKRVLVVEDCNFIAGVTALALQRAGHAVGRAGSCDVALDTFKNGSFDFDAVVSDQNTGDGITGVELLRALRKGGFEGPFILRSDDDTITLDGSDLLGLPFGHLRKSSCLGGHEEKPPHPLDVPALLDRLFNPGQPYFAPFAAEGELTPGRVAAHVAFGSGGA